MGSVKRQFQGVRFSGAGVFFGAAVFLALLAGISIYGFLQSAVPSATVLMLVRDLPPGSEVTAQDLAVRQVPESGMPEGAIREQQEAVGKRLRFGLVAGDVVRTLHLVKEASSEIPQRVTTLGGEYRAVMIPGELVPATLRLVPGDRLELLGVLPIQDSTRNTTVVMPVGLATILDIPRSESDRGMVLVALQAEEVARLALTMRSGTLVVAVQGSDQPNEMVPSLLLDDLTKAGMVAAKAEPPDEPVAASQKAGR